MQAVAWLRSNGILYVWLPSREHIFVLLAFFLEKLGSQSMGFAGYR